ncbi:unnamed protein product [Acanthoscelides obtectus]|uniref:Uncharacterized protein n=1 Tax=Acanthoscelides obtectus TaxID=200917 RepID=A0A9P0LYZ7_ACAOB|nr:unnamed protein product [Acanthoscelides obtectus]CAK1668452.1 hypothetical protein AOBTE_LOCUS26399 [Acanthoscelides obtectus]
MYRHLPAPVPLLSFHFQVTFGLRNIIGKINKRSSHMSA